MTNTMIRATIDATIAEESLDAEAGYERLVALTSALAVVHPSLGGWYSLANTKNGPTVPLQNKVAFLADATASSSDAEEPEGGFRATLSTAPDDKTWLAPGRALLTFEPSQGYITFEIYEPVRAHGEAATAELFRRALAAIAQIENLMFGATDVNARRQSGKGLEMYMGDHQLFPHRRWLGWMGFVPHPIESRHIPEAAALIPVGRKGTVIVAVDECFDLHNPAHLKRAHEVEARMAHLGLLEVTDASLLG
ncbi:immunity 52 family protein [Xanthomonas sp. AmX2]|uniref:Imm52 family immunity protein n=1 Tax=Xanthomonas sp. TaxID=29446 RepID=UPI00197EA41A|nr:Imm52 family immunity protein [Xanthomonas sp.]MBN6152791.1 immunity 52 family protein [Xanthomonas sp.]